MRVLLADDHTLIRRGLRDTLAEDPLLQVVGEAGHWDELQPLLGAPGCDVLLLDINLPGPSGLEILERLGHGPHAPRTLVVSMYPEDQYAVRALRAGALGYVNKACEPAVLMRAVHAVARGFKHISPEVASLLADAIAAPEHALPHHRLSAREHQLLVQIARGLKLPEIAEALQMAPKTVSVWRARVLEKMKMSSNAELEHYARRHGLVD